jgi:site-specific recombinase XerD
MTTGTQRSRQPKPLAAGAFQGEISSFRLHLAAEGKAAKTVRSYTEAVQWFAAAHLLRETSRTGWDQVSGQDIQRWMVWLLGRYSDSYASNQFRALQQFFRWWAQEEDLPDPMARIRQPRVTEKLVPVFTSGELSRLERACQGRGFAQRRDQAIVSVFRSTGVRLSELAGIRFDPGDPLGGDVDLERREIMIGGKGGKARIVRIGHETARSLDRYVRVRRRHAQAYRAELWLGVNNRGPLTANGIYQMIVRRGWQCGVAVFPHRFRHYFSHTWLDRGGRRAT